MAARLLNLAKQAKEDYQFYLVRYASERFLYRLGESTCRERCILKGAGLLMLWMPDPYRGTRDLDFLAYGGSDEQSVRKMITEICSTPCPNDGLTFDLDSVDITPIRSEEAYDGQRVRLTAPLGRARIRLQIDIGFGDAVTPEPEEQDFPTLLPASPAPNIRAYRREVSIAEKFHTMVNLGRRNSRMKDFHDIWALSSEFSFDGPVLREAIEACFARRRTEWSKKPPDMLIDSFYKIQNLQVLWTGYFRSRAFLIAPPEAFEIIGERNHAFLGPIRKSIAGKARFAMSWPPGGPWEPI